MLSAISLAPLGTRPERGPGSQCDRRETEAHSGGGTSLQCKGSGLGSADTQPRTPQAPPGLPFLPKPGWPLGRLPAALRGPPCPALPRPEWQGQLPPVTNVLWPQSHTLSLSPGAPGRAVARSASHTLLRSNHDPPGALAVSVPDSDRAVSPDGARPQRPEATSSRLRISPAPPVRQRQTKGLVGSPRASCPSHRPRPCPPHPAFTRQTLTERRLGAGSALGAGDTARMGQIIPALGGGGAQTPPGMS